VIITERQPDALMELLVNKEPVTAMTRVTLRRFSIKMIIRTCVFTCVSKIGRDKFNLLLFDFFPCFLHT